MTERDKEWVKKTIIRGALNSMWKDLLIEHKKGKLNRHEEFTLALSMTNKKEKERQEKVLRAQPEAQEGLKKIVDSVVAKEERREKALCN